MSAEGKKKRGVAGMSNAKNISFRYHGYPRGYRLDTTIGRNMEVWPSSRFLHAMILGAKLPSFSPTDWMYRAADAIMDRLDAGTGRKKKD